MPEHILHVLKDCPLRTLVTDRKEAKPENITYQAKLWGAEAELRYTAAFLKKKTIFK
jgi:hypothetical protein